MSNTVSFLIKIETTGEAGVKRVAVDAEKLGRAMQIATDDARSLNTGLLNLNQASEVIRGLHTGLQELLSVSNDLTSAYSVQEQSEVKLQTIMRQRMGATEADVESIKRLASEQQQLGVIGDEVQLSGAQQMATFLSERESIETLLPAMNNLLAQQKGLNATTQDAVSLGSMMGKAMQGQVDVLQRVGITFTDAQKQVLKFGSEQERASMLAEVIRDNVGEMNAALARTDAGRAQQLTNALGDLKESLGKVLSRAQPVMTALAQIGQTSTGMMSVASGVKGLTSALGTLSSSAGVARVSVMGLTVSVRGLLITSGVGVAILALTTIISRLGRSSKDATEDMDALSHGTEAYIRAAGEAKSEISAETSKLKELMDAKSDASAAVSALNEKYGESFGYYSTAAEWYDVLIKKSDAYIQQKGYEAEAVALQQKKAELEIEQELNKRKRQQLIDSGGQYEYVRRPNTSSGGVMPSLREPSRQTTSAFNAVSDALIEGDAAITRINRRLDIAREKAVEAGKALSEGLTSPPKETPSALFGGLSGMSSMDGVGLQSIDIEVKVNGIDDVRSQFETLGESLLSPVRLINELNDLLGDGTDVESYTDALAHLCHNADQLSETQASEMVEALQGAQETAAKSAERHAKKVAYAKESVSQFGGALSSMGTALDLPSLNIAGTIAQAIANIALSYSAATAQASEMGPWAWIAFAAAGLAEMTAVIVSIKNATAFADGGLVSGPTYALIGEYAGASNNPEVVAPLNKLEDMISPGVTSFPEHIELTADLRELRAALVKEGNRYRRV